jgi:hypothetical protein
MNIVVYWGVEVSQSIEYVVECCRRHRCSVRVVTASL